MVVVDHQPNEWILLRRDSEYFMEVTSGLSFQSISVIIKLDEQQAAQVLSGGRATCQKLAVDVADRWLDWDLLHPDDEAEVYGAIRAWRSQGAP